MNIGDGLRLVGETITAGNLEELRFARGVVTLRGDRRQRIRSEAEMAKAQGKGSAQAGDAATLLVEDHRKVRKIFDEFKKLKSGDVEKENLVRMARTELKIHAMLEEEIFYPAVREKLDETGLIDEAQVEHAVAKQLIGELEEMTPDEELYDAKFTVLGEYVNHHVAEEEKEIFPQARYASARKGNSAAKAGASAAGGCPVRRTVLDQCEQAKFRSAD